MELIKETQEMDTYKFTNDPSVLIQHRKDQFYCNDGSFKCNVRYKGLILSQMCWSWKKLLEEKLEIPNDLVSQEPKELIKYGVPIDFAGSAMLVKNCIPIPVLCFVNGYTSHEPPKLKEGIYIPMMIEDDCGRTEVFKSREHEILFFSEFIKEKLEMTSDANIELKAQELSDQLKKISLEAYEFAHEHALKSGIIISDAQLRFGFIKDSKEGDYQLALINDVFIPTMLKPAIGRATTFWNVEFYKEKRYQASMECFLTSRRYAEIIRDEEFSIKQSMIYIYMYKKIFGQNVVDLTSDIMWKWYEALN